jgi:hypothetical protein
MVMSPGRAARLPARSHEQGTGRIGATLAPILPCPIVVAVPRDR